MDVESRTVSLTRRTTVMLSLAIGVVSLGVTALLAVHAIRTDRLKLEAQADAAISYLAGSLEKPLWDLDVEGIRTTCRTFSNGSGVSDLKCTGEGGETFFSSGGKAAGDTLRRHATVRRQEKTLGQIDIAFADEPLSRSAKDIVRTAILMDGGILATIVLVTGVVIRVQLSRPLKKLSEIATEYGTGRYSPVGQRMPYREFQPFGAVLSEMAGRIGAQMREIRDANNSLAQRNEELEGAYSSVRGSERKARAMFNAAFGFTGLLSLDGRLLEANQTALDFAGVSFSDVTGKPFWETPWWSHSTKVQGDLQAAIRSAAEGNVVRFEATHPAADGAMHTIDVSLKPILDEQGRAVLLIVEGRDISDRKRAEEL